ncbi:hypothetical protein BEWA_021830 [Theileria equi strain WA]|uniref:HTH La-type RNA-binding domain-containing protein n=1 Tax=Theileria equi strain WA TaxID=1537102 RepID=L0AUW4_THEEQ|nr:hypothetical protein BEWA_021830 [Theileria equi strain WA]AFZ79335.1 hypothetical protein BEWA_021830 [Theileria equi strain WA]|eukprot:XP_004829001.1 hypothetical protein BEWA_021830 [Theileria equi strain WA]
MVNNNAKRQADGDSADHPKRRLVDDSVSDDHSIVDDLLKKDRLTNDEFVIVASKSTPEQRLSFISRQLAYYFSNDNLARDEFFHTKFSEDSAKTGVENSLDIKYILSSKRMLEVKATEDDLKKVVSENDYNLSIFDHDGTCYVKLDNPLPEYVGKKLFAKKKKFGETPETFHLAGPLVIVTNIPSSVTEWHTVKQSIQDAGKVKVRYISAITDGACYAWFSKTFDDLNAVKDINPVIDGETLKIDLINDESHYKNMISAMTLGSLNSRSKDLQRLKSASMSAPLELGGIAVRNFGTLRSLLNTLLDDSEMGTKIPLESQAGVFLSFLLDYHPHSFEKKGGNASKLSGFEVGQSANKDKKNQKCFYVVTKSVEGDKELKESLSISKCLEELRHVVHTLKKTDRTDFVKSLKTDA